MASTLPPKDRYWAVWLAFFILGVGTLLPWNFFITANKYFEERLVGEVVVEERGANSSEGPRPLTPLQRSFSNAMTLCAMVPLLIFTCLTSFLHARVPQRVRVLTGLVAILLLFVVTAALVRVPALDSRPTLFFSITMASIVLINSFGAVLQGSLFGLVGLLPVPYTTAVMSGQGIAGVFAALSMIFAMIWAQDERDSVFGYFVTACVVTLVAIVAYLSLSRLAFARHYLTPGGDLDGNPGLISPGEREQDGVAGGILMVEEPSYRSRPALNMSVVQVFLEVWPMAICVCLVYTVTLAVFPAVTAGIHSSSQDPAWRRFFVPVWCFLVFNIFDWAGRSATAVFLISTTWVPPVLVGARTLFIPLFMLCNTSPDNRSLPVLFHHDAAYIIFMIIFAFSNGYLASHFMCCGSMRLSGPDSETAGTVMMFFLSLGLALGAAFSFLFRVLL